ncbi:putative membrane spanning protein [Granulibacter bethesdensis]|uniref:PepSY-associated TM helix domain-containing protein n=1 Tax=Granulibacter bethesdensis TaxID=364410 RepID=UPI000909D11E|nr:PepSY-associated TM helix domain-containing protein [Granulibacter bethesdensis]APH57290.1 putative membrane spanning protein [Granulibacter bethesdensis]
MKKGFVQSMTWLHSWSGLVFGWLLFAVFLCGTLTIFDKEISQWMRPELPPIAMDTETAAKAASLYLQTQGLLDQAMREVTGHTSATIADPTKPRTGTNRHGVRRWLITLPTRRVPELRVAASGPRREGTLIDQVTGAPLHIRQSQGGAFFFLFHFTLFADRTGEWFVGAAAMAMLAAIVSGVIIHFKRLLKDIFTFRPASSAQRSWLDAHAAGAVLALPFHTMFAYTGLFILFTQLMPSGIMARYPGQMARFAEEAGIAPYVRPETGTAASLLPLDIFVHKAEARMGPGSAGYIAILNPGDRAQTVEIYRYDGDRVAWSRDHIAYDGTTGDMLHEAIMQGGVSTTAHTLWGLHYAQFGGRPVHWLYFLSGLASCGMISSGLVLFTIKRRQRHETDPVAHALFLAAEKLNVTFVAGISIACVAYLWANRLLPPDLPGHDQAEIKIFFGSWLLTLLHPLFRSPRRAWLEQLSLLAALLLLLPFLNMATTQTGLTHTLLDHGAGRDWARAGVDLTSFMLGLAASWAVWKIAVHRPKVTRSGRSAVTAGA